MTVQPTTYQLQIILKYLLFYLKTQMKNKICTFDRIFLFFFNEQQMRNITITLQPFFVTMLWLPATPKGHFSAYVWMSDVQLTFLPATGSVFRMVRWGWSLGLPCGGEQWALAPQHAPERPPAAPAVRCNLCCWCWHLASGPAGYTCSGTQRHQ